jgi:hypothetical protein
MYSPQGNIPMEDISRGETFRLHSDGAIDVVLLAMVLLVKLLQLTPKFKQPVQKRPKIPELKVFKCYLNDITCYRQLFYIWIFRGPKGLISPHFGHSKKVVFAAIF